MTHSIASPDSSPTPLTAEHLAALLPCFPALALIAQHLLDFPTNPVTPAATHQFETDLQNLLREAGRCALEHTLNHLEPDEADAPDEMHSGGNRYRRRRKSPTDVDSTFGRLLLWRWLYEPRDVGERCLFPLQDLLGLVAGRATPALASHVGILVAQHPQRDVLRLLRRYHGVKWSHALLRSVAAAVAEAVSGQRHTSQMRQVVNWLRQAFRSRGRFEPVLAVGRDGVMVPIIGQKYQEASVATIAVYDRRGKRLGTVYLGCMPEKLQRTLTKQLTDLLQAILTTWKGQRPRLTYITDGGSIPESYFREVLAKMIDPARPGERLDWVRVLDFYHAVGYIGKLAEALFGRSLRARQWARRMRGVLKAGGLGTVLQSASYHRNAKKLRGGRKKDFWSAYRYLHKRREEMRYDRYRAQGRPIGSGVTEAGCKVVASQRLKQSGMKWGKEGGEVVLKLRVVWLSGVWEKAWESHLRQVGESIQDTYGSSARSCVPVAA